MGITLRVVRLKDDFHMCTSPFKTPHGLTKKIIFHIEIMKLGLSKPRGEMVLVSHTLTIGLKFQL